MIVNTSPVSNHFEFSNHFPHCEKSQHLGTNDTSSYEIFGAQVPDHIKHVSWAHRSGSSSRRVRAIRDEVLETCGISYSVQEGRKIFLKSSSRARRGEVSSRLKDIPRLGKKGGIRCDVRWAHSLSLESKLCDLEGHFGVVYSWWYHS